MDMPDPSVANLSIDDPKCVQAAEACIAFYAAENASQEAVPFPDLFKYGHWTVYYYVIIIGLLFLFQVYNIMKDRAAKGSTSTPASIAQKPSIWRKVQAAARSIFYRRLPPRGPIRFLDAPPNIGTLSFLLLTLLFLIGLTFAARPYYRPHLGYGSPPIAIRSGLMAFACTPILVALSGKANLITLFTGISHERLNVLHRWVAWMSFGLSLIHSIPYFIASYRDFGNGGFARVKSEFYHTKTGAGEYTGTPPLAILFGLCVLSLPWIRHRFYESFYAAHILLAITYLGLLFWHAANTLDSWAYLWATLAIWLSSWLTRAFWKTQPFHIKNTWFSGAPATLTLLPGDITRIDVWQAGEFKWTPASHVFLRFTDIAPLENHPFTIASVHDPSSSASSSQHLVFLARAHAGFTHKLASHVRAQGGEKENTATTTVWVDGPYGGIHRPLHSRYDSLILIAGGTGITACLPWLLHATKLARSPRLKRVVLVWAVRHADALEWFGDELASLAAKELGIEVVMKFHVTGSPVELGDGDTLGGKKKDFKSHSTSVGEIEGERPKEFAARGRSSDDSSHYKATNLGSRIPGRPVMAAVIREQVRPGERTMVVGCGPDSFRADIANAVAGAQSRVLSGECVELAMHMETFGW